MSSNPYKSPETISDPVANPARPPVRLVAKYQRWVIFALLGNISANILSFVTSTQTLPVRILVILFLFAVVIFAMASVFLLAKEIIGTTVGILCAILMIAPCISLIVLLILNQKATSYLQKNGVRVGFFGANPNRM